MFLTHDGQINGRNMPGLYIGKFSLYLCELNCVKLFYIPSCDRPRYKTFSFWCKHGKKTSKEHEPQNEKKQRKQKNFINFKFETESYFDCLYSFVIKLSCAQSLLVTHSSVHFGTSDVQLKAKKAASSTSREYRYILNFQSYKC